MLTATRVPDFENDIRPADKPRLAPLMARKMRLVSEVEPKAIARAIARWKWLTRPLASAPKLKPETPPAGVKVAEPVTLRPMNVMSIAMLREGGWLRLCLLKVTVPVSAGQPVQADARVPVPERLPDSIAEPGKRDRLPLTYTAQQ